MKEKNNKKISDEEIDFLDDLDLDLDDLDLDDIDDLDEIEDDVIESDVKDLDLDEEEIIDSKVEDLEDLDDLDFDFDDEEKEDKKEKEDEDDFSEDEEEIVEKKKETKSNKKNSEKASKNTSTTKSASKKITEIEEDEEEEEIEETEGVSGFAKIAGVLIILAVIIFLLIKGCAKEEYTVKFDTNGGNTISEQKIEKNGKVSRPEDPTREGYEFVGWYIGDDVYDFESEITENVTIEARWQDAAKAAVSGVTLDQTVVTIKPGGAIILTATVNPDNAANKSVTWVSSNPTVATVDENGNVTALKAGTAYITVTTKEGNFSAKATVVVSQDVVAVTGVTVTPTTANVGVNNTVTLTAKVTPANASNRGITWTSSNNAIATVNANGVVKGIKEGTVTITATSKDGGYKATANVVVKHIPVTGVTVTPTSVTMLTNTTKQFTAKVAPTNASVKNVTWSVENGTGKGTITQTGAFTAKQAGTVTVVATTKDGNKVAKVTVTINDPIKVSGITIEGAASVQAGSKITLKAVVAPTNATVKTVTWTSTDKTIATVNANGVVTGVKAGSVTIKATAKDGSGVVAEKTITVTPKPVTYNLTISIKVNSCVYGKAAQWGYTVTNGGKAFSDYKGVTVGSISKPFGSVFSGTQIEAGKTYTGSVTLSDGTKQNATVVVPNSVVCPN